MLIILNDRHRTLKRAIKKAKYNGMLILTERLYDITKTRLVNWIKNQAENATNQFLDQQIIYFKQRHKDDIVDAAYYGMVNRYELEKKK